MDGGRRGCVPRVGQQAVKNEVTGSGTRGNSTSVYDRNGRFNGTAIRNSPPLTPQKLPKGDRTSWVFALKSLKSFEIIGAP
jgi:hypothetical protein